MRLVAVAIALATMTGSVSASEPASERAGSPAVTATQPAFTAAAAVVRFATVAQQHIDDEPRFNARLLRDTIVAELTARGLLGDQAGGRVVDIQIDEFSLRNTSNVVVFGKVASAGKLSAVVRAQDANGGPQRQARVAAEASLSLRKDDYGPETLMRLYRRLAQAIGDELARPDNPAVTLE